MSAEKNMNKMISKELDEIRPLILTHASYVSPKRGNTCFDKYTYSFCKAFEEGYGLELAKLCIKDREPAVRRVGAYYLLPYRTFRAKMVLWRIIIRNKLSRKSRKFHPLEALTADAILIQWGKKELTFPRLINGEVTYLNIDKIKEEKL